MVENSIDDFGMQFQRHSNIEGVWGSEVLLKQSVHPFKLEKIEKSAIFCVGLPNENYLKVNLSQVQRRIDLLAIEQNAWKLAACDKRCVVVETKTELDWAVKNGQISVWAPAKMLLDAKNLPKFDLHKLLSLSEWLANEFGAEYLTVIGDIQDNDCSIKLETIPLN